MHIQLLAYRERWG